MKAHIGGVVVYTTFHMNVHALGKTKPPSGGSQGVFSTLATNKQTKSCIHLKTSQKIRIFQIFVEFFLGLFWIFF